MTLKLILIHFLMFVACNQKKDDKELFAKLPYPIDLSEFANQADELTKKLPLEFTHERFIVAKNGDGTIEDYEDAAKITGIAAGILPCEDARYYEGALQDVLRLKGGFPSRNKEGSCSIKNGCTSLDMEHGYLFGVPMFIKRCGAPADGIIKHYNFVLHKNYKLEDDREDSFWHGMRFYFHRILLQLGIGQEKYDRRMFEVQSLAIAEGVQSAKMACFNLDLVFLETYQLLYFQNNISANYLEKICGTTKNLGLANWDWICKRLDVKDYLANFKFHEKSYSLSRCERETESHKEGFKSPSLDWLMIYNIAKGL